MITDRIVLHSVLLPLLIKTPCLCYLPKPKAEADNTDLGFDNYNNNNNNDNNNNNNNNNNNKNIFIQDNHISYKKLLSTWVLRKIK